MQGKSLITPTKSHCFCQTHGYRHYTCTDRSNLHRLTPVLGRLKLGLLCPHPLKIQSILIFSCVFLVDISNFLSGFLSYPFLRSAVMEMERVTEFPLTHLDRRPRKRARLGWDVPQAPKVSSWIFNIMLLLMNFTCFRLCSDRSVLFS